MTKSLDTYDLARELFNRLYADNNRWKYPWLKEICRLCAEYLMLDGLVDGLRSVQIPEEILDIAEKQL